jgi:hypothetical protein
MISKNPVFFNAEKIKSGTKINVNSFQKAKNNR